METGSIARSRSVQRLGLAAWLLASKRIFAWLEIEVWLIYMYGSYILWLLKKPRRDIPYGLIFNLNIQYSRFFQHQVFCCGSDPYRELGNVMVRLTMKCLTVLVTTTIVMLGSLANADPISLSPDGQKASAPDIAVNLKGDIAVLWVDRSPQEKPGNGAHHHDRHLAVTDVYVSISKDGGNTFSAPTKVNASSGAVWGQQVSRPRIVGTPNGTWHVAYSANDIHPTLNKTLLTTHYTRSIDGGQSFEAPKRLSSVTGQDMSDVIHGGFASAAAFGTMASAPDGSVHVYWVDTRHMKPDSDSGALYGSTSRDDGQTFTADKQLFDTSVCPCCQLTAVANSRSEVVLGSRRVEKDSFRPATVMTLSHKDETILDRQSIGGAPWQINGCPLKPTVVALHGKNVFAAVHNGGETTPGVIFSVSNDEGKSFKPLGIVQPDAAVSDAPTITVNGSRVLLAWHAKLGSAPRRVYYRFYNLSGEPMGEIRELNSGSGTSQFPVAAARSDGRFQLLWQQADRIWSTTLSDK